MVPTQFTVYTARPAWGCHLQPPVHRPQKGHGNPSEEGTEAGALFPDPLPITRHLVP